VGWTTQRRVTLVRCDMSTTKDPSDGGEERPAADPRTERVLAALRAVEDSQEIKSAHKRPKLAAWLLELLEMYRPVAKAGCLKLGEITTTALDDDDAALRRWASSPAGSSSPSETDIRRVIGVVRIVVECRRLPKIGALLYDPPDPPMAMGPRRGR
jgi:hypothetical protein